MVIDETEWGGSYFMVRSQQVSIRYKVGGYFGKYKFLG